MEQNRPSKPVSTKKQAYGNPQEYNIEEDLNFTGFVEGETFGRQTEAQHNQSQQRKQQQSQFNENINVMSKKAHQQMHTIGNNIKHDMNTDISMDKSKYGFNLFVYALLCYAFFIFGSWQNLLILTGWLIIVEKNEELVKMTLSAILIALGLHIVYSCWTIIDQFVTTVIFPVSSTGTLASLTRKLFNAFDGIMRVGYDVLTLVIGLYGMLRAKSKKFLSLKQIDKLFI